MRAGVITAVMAPRTLWRNASDGSGRTTTVRTAPAGGSSHAAIVGPRVVDDVGEHGHGGL
jgi:hypothetical protein